MPKKSRGISAGDRTCWKKARLHSTRNALFNEYIDDKRLGQWLKAALDSSAKDPKVEAVKLEILFTYTQAW